MKKLSFKLVAAINLVFAFSFIAFLFISDQYLKDFYLNQKQKQLKHFVTDLKRNSNLDSRQKNLNTLPEAIVFEIHSRGNEQQFNAEIRQNLVKRRIQFNKIWFPLAQIQNMLSGNEREYVARQPLLQSYLLVRIFKAEENRVFLAGLVLADVEQTLSVAKVFFTLIAIVIAVCSSLVVSLIIYRFTKPVSLITEKSQRMTRMDFTGVLNIDTGDELEALSNSTNKLSENLAHAITSLDLSNQRLEQDIARKDKTEKLLKEFLGNVSHELKTPIALISGYSQGLIDEVSDKEERHKFCEVIIDEAQNMSSLVEELLEITEAESGLRKLAKEVFDIKKLMTDTVSKQELNLRRKKISLIVNIPTTLVYADPVKIERVLRNLISNAINHTHYNGEIKLDLSVSEVGPTIRVFNDGSPIPEDMLEEIWKPFIQVPSAQNHNKEGTGLGLAIAASILNQHQSEFGVQNHTGSVEFYFTLERAHEAAVATIDAWTDSA